MRNLILFAVAFSVVLTEADVLELGYDVAEVDFRNYFGIPEDAVLNADAVKSTFAKTEGFKVADVAYYLDGNEKKALAKRMEAEKGTSTSKPKATPAAGTTTATSAADKKAAAEAKKAEAEAEKARKKAEAEAKKKENEKPKELALWKKIFICVGKSVEDEKILGLFKDENQSYVKRTTAEAKTSSEKVAKLLETTPEDQVAKLVEEGMAIVVAPKVEKAPATETPAETPVTEEAAATEAPATEE